MTCHELAERLKGYGSTEVFVKDGDVLRPVAVVRSSVAFPQGIIAVIEGKGRPEILAEEKP